MIKLSSLLEFEGGTAPGVSIGAGPRSSTVKKARKMLDKQASIYEDKDFGSDTYLKTLYDKYGEDKTREFLTRSADRMAEPDDRLKFRHHLDRFNRIMKQ